MTNGNEPIRRIPIRHKFNARAEVHDGIRFPSQKEKKYYDQLVLAKRSGELAFFLRQVPLHLPGNVKYLCDFVEFWANGEVRFVDTKGYRTPMYKTKLKIVRELYPIEIIEA